MKQKRARQHEGSETWRGFKENHTSSLGSIARFDRQRLPSPAFHPELQKEDYSIQ
ncbi:MAG: hypothetical protein ACFFB3_18730 [Candidatus Hodarchaeota archaeon]